MEKIVEIYIECGDFYESVRKSGLPILTAHKILLRSGILKIQDKIKYGSEAGKKGGEAEEYFQKLVPEAIDANKYWKKNNPIFDFNFKGLNIDVKYSSITVRSEKNINWWVRAKGTQDITVAFLEREKGKALDKPNILLIPQQFITQKCMIYISKNGDYFKMFQVKEQDLVKELEEYADLKKKKLI